MLGHSALGEFALGEFRREAVAVVEESRRLSGAWGGGLGWPLRPAKHSKELDEEEERRRQQLERLEAVVAKAVSSLFGEDVVEAAPPETVELQSINWQAAIEEGEAFRAAVDKIEATIAALEERARQEEEDEDDLLMIAA